MYEMQWLIVASEIDKNCFLNECLEFMPFALKKLLGFFFYFHVFVFKWWDKPKGFQLLCACAIQQITRVGYDCLYSWQWKVKQHVIPSIVSLHGFDFSIQEALWWATQTFWLAECNLRVWRMKFIFIQIYGTAILWSPFACFIKLLIFLIFSQHCIIY